VTRADGLKTGGNTTRRLGYRQGQTAFAGSLLIIALREHSVVSAFSRRHWVAAPRSDISQLRQRFTCRQVVFDRIAHTVYKLGSSLSILTRLQLFFAGFAASVVLLVITSIAGHYRLRWR
jgi:hypothetical protein